MKKIDWTKPVRIGGEGIMSHDPVKVIAVHGDQAFVTWGSEMTAHVADEYGRIQVLPGWRVENVPEEPKDTLRLYKSIFGGPWVIDGKIDTWKNQEEYRQRLSPDIAANMVLVRVPV